MPKSTGMGLQWKWKDGKFKLERKKAKDGVFNGLGI